MTALKVDFVGIRTNRLDETVALLRDVLGVESPARPRRRCAIPMTRIRSSS